MILLADAECVIKYNSLIINIFFLTKIALKGQTGDKNRIKKERKTIKTFQKGTLKCRGQNLSFIVLFCLSFRLKVRFGINSKIIKSLHI